MNGIVTDEEIFERKKKSKVINKVHVRAINVAATLESRWRETQSICKHHRVLDISCMPRVSHKIWNFFSFFLFESVKKETSHMSCLALNIISFSVLRFIMEFIYELFLIHVECLNIFWWTFLVGFCGFTLDLSVLQDNNLIDCFHGGHFKNLHQLVQ